MDCLFIRLVCHGSLVLFFFQAEDGIRDLVRSRGLGDVYKRQESIPSRLDFEAMRDGMLSVAGRLDGAIGGQPISICLLYTSDAADERSSVDLGGRRIIKKKNMSNHTHTITPRDSTITQMRSERNTIKTR